MNPNLLGEQAVSMTACQPPRDPPPAGHRLARFFQPTSITVVGASDATDKIGGRVMSNLLTGGFGGRLVPVNQRASRVGGLEALPRVTDLAEPTDLAILAIPAEQVLETLQQCVTVGISAGIVLSAGFAEASEAGKARQDRLAEFARASGFTLWGPNCLGLIGTRARAAACATPIIPFHGLRAGPAAVLSQSGGLGGSLLGLLGDRGIGYTYFASVGNEIDVSVAECLEFVVEDPDTRVVAMILETLRDPDRFALACNRARALGKVVAVLKLGTTHSGAAIARSHTGAISGPTEGYQAAFERLGAVNVNSLAELAAVTMVAGRAHPIRGSRVAVVTGMGGGAIHLADQLAQNGLTLVPLPTDRATHLKAVLPPGIPAQNPVDVGADVDAMPPAMAALAADRAADMIISVRGPTPSPRAERLAEAIVGCADETDTPMLACWMGGQISARATDLFDGSRSRVVSLGDAALLSRAVGLLARWDKAALATSTWRPVSHGSGVPFPSQLNELRGKQLLAAHGIPVVNDVLVRTAESAVLTSDQLGYPVVLKVVSPDLPHKAGVGGVRTNLRSPGEVRSAFQEILDAVAMHAPDAMIDGVTVEPQIVGDELFVGVQFGHEFGPLMTIGPGGPHVEWLRGFVHSVVPLLPAEAATLLADASLVRQVVQGPHSTQDQAAQRFDAFCEIISRLSEFAVANAHTLAELDVNPVILTPSGDARVLDCLMVPRGAAS